MTEHWEMMLRWRESAGGVRGDVGEEQWGDGVTAPVSYNYNLFSASGEQQSVLTELQQCNTLRYSTNLRCN